MRQKLFLIFFIYCSFLNGGTDGTIRGKVTDIDGVPMPGANIYIPAISMGAAADLNGNYIILNVPVDDYDVVVQMMGYQKQTIKEVRVMMDQTVWLNFTLNEANVELEEVVILGERPLVEKGATSKKVTVAKEAIQALPIRDLTDLYTLQSGVVKIESRTRGVPDNEERGLEEIHVRGGRSGQIAYMMDGMYLRNPIYGGIGSGTRLNIFAVKEFDFQQGGFNAEYGDAQSAVSNYHTNSGGKDIEYHFRYETSQVGSMLNILADSRNKDATRNFDKIRGYNDYMFGVGGPILGLPKLFFWVSGQYSSEDYYDVFEFDDKVYQGRKIFLNEGDVNLDTLNMNKSNLVSPWDDVAGFRGFGFTKTWDIFAKLTYKFSNKLRINGNYWQVANHRQSFNPRYLYWNGGQQELFRDTYRYNFELNHSLTPRTFYTLRFSNFTQDQFQGVRWRDNDGDGYPNWFEWRHPAGPGGLGGWIKEISDPDNPFVVPYTIGEDGDTVRYTMVDDRSGWYYGAVPGLYNWDLAEDWDDVDQNGIWDEGELWTDSNSNGIWDGPALVQEAINRDGSYWLTPEMYESYEDFLDAWHIYYQWDNVPGYGYFPLYTGAPDDPYYFAPTPEFEYWDEGSAFGGHDNFFADSQAETDEVRFDITSQLTDQWKIRTGLDYKYHKLNFFEVKYPWLGAGAFVQTFAEYWNDSGPDGLVLGDEGYVEADAGEGNNVWDPGETFTDANGNGSWDEFRQPKEFNVYIQNTFEVPWMVINYGIRADFVNYNTQIWADTAGNYSPGRPWFFSDLNNNDRWDAGEKASDLSGLARQKVFLKDSGWNYKISPRIGFSHVITDKSTFTFSYGLYMQNPIYQDVYLNTNRLENPEELFEESEQSVVGNATLGAEKTQEYSAGLNVQVGRSWKYSIMAWVKDMDQMTRYNHQRSGVYTYSVGANGDYGSAKGIDIDLEWRGRMFGSKLQYGNMITKQNSEYAWASISGQYIDAPSQESITYFDRPHTLTYWLYTMLPFGINTSLVARYESGTPYTPMIFSGRDPTYDGKNPNSKRSPGWKDLDISFSKYISTMGHRIAMGLNVYNVLDIRNAVDVYPLTGKPLDPGEYYTNYVGLPGTDPAGAGVSADKSSAYYDRPWRLSQPREINFFIRIDFEK